MVTILPFEVYEPLSHIDSTPALPTNQTFGMAYRIGAKDLEFVSSYLNHREKDGYSLVKLDVYGVNGNMLVQGANVYTATYSNAGFDPRNVAETCLQIVTSSGPSGERLY